MHSNEASPPREPAYPNGCFFPGFAVAVHTQGEARFCLTSKAPPQKTLMDLASVSSVVRSEWAAGKVPEGCRSCNNKERSGQWSRRLRTWSRKSRIYGPEELANIVAGTPSVKHLEISFSNLCNLSCAMCSSEFSTSWLQGDALARERGLEFRGFTAAFDSPKRLSGTLLEEVFEASKEVDLVIIKGGEPTLEPLFFEFMESLKERGNGRMPSVFLQTNGTRQPSHWLGRVEGFELDVGVSLDGWEDTYEWIRGTSFASVLANIEALDAAAQVKSLTIDFTLSQFNCLHLPRFLREVLAIRERLPKLRHCPVFQWAHQEYASPLVLGLSDRMRVLREVEPILEAHGNFFLDHRALLKVLSMPQLPASAISAAARWLDFMNEKRGRSLPDDASIRSSFGNGIHA